MLVGCDKCGSADIRTVMILDDLWKTIAQKKDILCVKCIETLLGRPLTLLDLKPCLVTSYYFFGAYLAGNMSKCLPDDVLLNPDEYTNKREWLPFPEETQV